MNYESRDPEIQGCIDAAYQIGMAQHADEIVPFAEAVKRELQPTLVLEIGSHKGGTAALWLSLVKPGGGVYSIDLPGGPWGGIGHAECTTRNAMLSVLADAQGKNFAGHLGDSKSREAFEFANSAASSYGQYYDLIFIDGDHSYAGVQADFHLAMQLVREGGWIVLHDIIEGPIHERDKVEVSRLWDDLKHRDAAPTREFVGKDGAWGGIGLVIA